MILRSFTAELDAETAEAMNAFEKEFSYPLGETDRFRISHQPHYLRFFQAMGKAHLLVAMKGDTVLGSLVTVRRQIIVGGEQLDAHYFCDLKILPATRGSRTLARLFAATQSRIRAAGGSLACYGVVMDACPATTPAGLRFPLFPQSAGSPFCD